ncbi:MAG: hypothetical protein HY905_21590, partial [Deltaproteobacteria bacterium]|nr:hypothetical protein [Deltaproteobacteria bacterium]
MSKLPACLPACLTFVAVLGEPSLARAQDPPIVQDLVDREQEFQDYLDAAAAADSVDENVWPKIDVPDFVSWEFWGGYGQNQGNNGDCETFGAMGALEASHVKVPRFREFGMTFRSVGDVPRAGLSGRGEGGDGQQEGQRSSRTV